jgi:hypothetical protein
MPDQTCPSTQCIENYLLGRLSDDEQAGLEEHFLCCEACAGFAELLAALVAAIRDAHTVLPYVENRSTARQPALGQVEVQVEDKPERIAAELRDLSPSGMGLIASRAVDVGARLTVRLKSRSIVGRVRYCRPITDGFRIGLSVA